MADVGTVYVNVVPSTKGFGKALTGEAEKAGDDAGKKAGKKSGEKFVKATETTLGKNFIKIGDISTKYLATVGKAAMKAGVVAAGGISAIGVATVNAYSDFEQLSGGIEKIFGADMYDQILKDANGAFKTLNISANDYMRNISGVGATFAQTLGDKKGYETAVKGMQAIADYASGTGKPVEQLMEKYQMISRSSASYLSIADQFAGILPQTTEDFLAQAQEAGFLSDQYQSLTEVPVAEYQEAITSMLERGVDQMGLLGNTVAETEGTLSGSIGAMKASWENWIAALGQGVDMTPFTESLTSSISNVIANVVPTVIQIGTSIAAALPEVAAQIGAAIETQVLPVLDELTGGAATKLWDAFAVVKDAFIQFAQTDLQYLVDLLSFFATTVLPPLIELLPEVAAVVTAGAIAFAALSAAIKGIEFVQKITGMLPQFAAPADAAAKSAGKLATAAGGSAASLAALGAAALGIGAGIAFAAVGIATLVDAAIRLGAAGAPAGVAMVGLAAGIAALVAGLALAGPALTASAVGIGVFGAAVLAMGAGVAAAGAGVMLMGEGVALIAKSGSAAASSVLPLAAGVAALAAASAPAAATATATAAALVALAAAAVGATASTIAYTAACVAAVASTQALGKATTQMANQIKTGTKNAAKEFDTLKDKAKNAADDIKRAFSDMKLSIPSPSLGKMPHFSLSGKFDLQAGTVPKINVSWYAKGGVFSSPSIIGVGDASTPEVVAPQAMLYETTREASRDANADVVAAIERLMRSLPAIIEDSTPTIGQRDLQRMVRSYV